MCSAEKCCFFLPTDVGCIILGVITFLISLASVVLSMITLFIEESEGEEGVQYIDAIFHLNMNAASIRIVLSSICVMELIWMLFSVLLVIGICKNKPNFVLCYFGFGVLMSIVWSLSGLLVLLGNHWVIAMITFICVCVYTHCLMVVHLIYEQMLSGKLSRFTSYHDSDLTILVDSELGLPESELSFGESLNI